MEIQTRANNVLAKLHTWSLNNSLTINTSKTKAVLFRAKSKKVNFDLALFLGPSKIEVVPAVKCLGVLFNENMSWDLQSDSVCSSLSRTVGILSRTRFLLPEKVKLLLYNSLFLSKLCYCYLVWGTTTISNILRISRLQKRAVRLIVNAPYNAHTRPLCKNLNVIPVDDLYESLLIKRYKQGIKTNNLCLK